LLKEKQQVEQLKAETHHLSKQILEQQERNENEKLYIEKLKKRFEKEKKEFEQQRKAMNEEKLSTEKEKLKLEKFEDALKKQTYQIEGKSHSLLLNSVYLIGFLFTHFTLLLFF
jgi:hypothetical protein